MSSDASVSFDWADGHYTFRLALGQIRELQEKTDCGPEVLKNRIWAGQWRVDDLRETIRLGLIGGGMAPPDALKLVRRYVDDRPLLESKKPAYLIIVAALAGCKDDPVGKDSAGEGKSGADPTMDASLSPPSTEPAAQ